MRDNMFYVIHKETAKKYRVYSLLIPYDTILVLVYDFTDGEWRTIPLDECEPLEPENYLKMNAHGEL